MHLDCSDDGMTRRHKTEGVQIKIFKHQEEKITQIQLKGIKKKKG